ncbi:hypothetical protein [Massilia rubra]|uniref:Flagellar hook-length control protein FliK n=1 Tax=Massilia rubra TaxID=2607910 RepID=A0ABX0LCT7_9BURK|nr:hypothetical protein [Massilia rubra]NHZ32683.1 hypothetical protein [Massilia rubra]
MTIELRARIPAPARDDDPPPPVRRPAPPRYAPHSAPRAAPGATTTPPAARARMRDAQAARQADARRERAATDLADADPHAPCIDAFAPLRERCQGGEPDGGNGAVAGVGSAAASGDAGVEEALLGLRQQQGIFELLLPGGQTLGVVVQPVAGGVHFMLSAGGGVLEQRLRQNKMELERRLQQRMQKDVRIAVL